MKNKIYIGFLIVCLTLSGTSCEESLEVIPPGEFAPGNVLTNENGLTALLYSAYSYYNQNRQFKEIVNISEMSTDVAYNTGGGENRYLSLYMDFTWDPSEGQLQFQWNQAFFAIRDANLLLDNLENAAIDEQVKTLLKAEARYLRATEYAHLFNWFGPAPLITNFSNEVEPRASEEEMKAFIEKELTEIVPSLPDPGQAAQYGRATKGHALGILTKFYLNTKQWNKVVATTQQIMNLGFYTLFPDFTKLFRVENEFDKNPANREMLVTWPQLPEEGLGNQFPCGAFPPGFSYAEKLPELKWNSAMANWGTQYRLKDDFVDTFDPVDERFGLIITEYINLDGNNVNLREFPDNCRSLKYFDINAIGNFHGNDQPIVRYADILLSRAEALNELNGPTQEALNLINEVRNRANLDNLTLADAGSKETLRGLILRERGWEFVSEGKRREDLIRHGKFISSAVERGINTQPFRVRFPIPEGEINTNPEIVQNEGY